MSHVDPNLKTDQIMVGTWDPRVTAAVFDVLAELHSAQVKHPIPFHSLHEGHSVLREEFEELWDEIIKQRVDVVKVRKEAIQTAAMALRFLVEIAPRLDGPPPVQGPADVAGVPDTGLPMSRKSGEPAFYND